MNYIKTSILAIALCSIALSCNDEDTLQNNVQDNIQGGNQEGTQDNSPNDDQGSAAITLNDALTEWGTPYDDVVAHMDGYESNATSDENTLHFSDNKGREVAYRFHNNQLCATLVTFDANMQLDYGSLLSDYIYLGELDGCNIHEDIANNTMASVWKEEECVVVGFAPIKSDAYEQAEPIAAITGDCFNVGISTAELSGSVTGADEVTEVGFIYGTTMEISESNGKKTGTTSSSDFTISISNLYDETHYYYRAYAIINDTYYLGEVKEFTTIPYTYVMDGRTFGLVRIEGDGDYIKPFSIMQTEVTDLHLVDSNDDGVVTINEVRAYVRDLIQETGLEWRIPTSKEWLYAAKGGDMKEDWVYSGSDQVDDVAWYSDNSGGRAHGPALKAPNSIGLYDMCGNYKECCASDEYPYFCNQNINTAIDGTLRGGSWKDSSSNCKIYSVSNSITTGRIPTSGGMSVSELYAFDAKTIRFRLAYSRNDTKE